MESRTKTYLVKSSFFELKIFWNGTLVKTQGAALLALILVALFGSNPTLKHGCVTLIVLDIIVVMFMLCKDVQVKELKPKKSKQSTEENSADTEPTKITKDTVASIEKSPTKVKQPKKSNKPEPEIKNKVGVPKSSEDGFAPVADIDESTPVTVPEPNLGEQVGGVKTKDVDDMTAEDWAELFKME